MSTTISKPSHTNEQAAPVQVMQMANAYWASRCLYTIAELAVADHLGDQPQSTEALAKATGANAEVLYRVLRLLASHGIFAWKDGAWHHTDASRILRSDQAGSLRDYIRMIGMPAFWRAFEHLDHSIRTGEPAFLKIHPAGVFAYLGENPELSSIFNGAMTAKAHGDIAAILPAYDFSQFATIADIGGGRGHLLRAILKTAPATQGILFDQAHVVKEVSPQKDEKLNVVGGSFFTDPIPKADAYLIMNVIHDWADAEAIQILSAVRRDMPRHARVLLIETIVPAAPEPHYSKQLDIVMLAIPGGKERTEAEYAELAARCGLRLDRVVDTQSPLSILEMVAA